MFLTFGIIGVEFFGGLLWRCESAPGTVLYGIDKAGCAAAGLFILSLSSCGMCATYLLPLSFFSLHFLAGGEWNNPHMGHFDHIGSAVLLLFELSTGEGWPAQLCMYLFSSFSLFFLRLIFFFVLFCCCFFALIIHYIYLCVVFAFVHRHIGRGAFEWGPSPSAVWLHVQSDVLRVFHRSGHFLDSRFVCLFVCLGLCLPRAHCQSVSHLCAVLLFPSIMMHLHILPPTSTIRIVHWCHLRQLSKDLRWKYWQHWTDHFRMLFCGGIALGFLCSFLFSFSLSRHTLGKLVSDLNSNPNG